MAEHRQHQAKATEQLTQVVAELDDRCAMVINITSNVTIDQDGEDDGG